MADSSVSDAGEAVYKIKYIKYPPGEAGCKCAVLLQDLNGPCPLIALANILLLRGIVTLPENVGEISQERAIALVANRLLEIPSSAENSRASEEYKANLQANLSDALTLLPKLATGLDVNVRFDSIRSFEFTNEIAVFDLLNIEIVHGWCFDPQDPATAAAVGRKSYNQLVAQLITAMGNVEPTPLRTSTKQAAAQIGTAGSPVKLIDAGALADALRSTLQLAGGPGGEETPRQSDGAATLSHQTASSPGGDSVVSSVNQLLGEVVNDAFRTPRPRGDTQQPTTENQASSPQPPIHTEPPLIQLDEGGSSSELHQQPQKPRPTPDNTAEPSGMSSLISRSEPGSPPPSLASGTTMDVQGVVGRKESEEVTGPLAKGATAGSSSMTGGGGNGGNQETGTSAAAAVQKEDDDTRELLLCQQYFESTPSQLTVHGLTALHEGLSDGQLAVFFRNNHFNVLLKSAGQLHILVTDQGYLYEPDVVWEKLTSVDGDTELVNADHEPFKPHVGSGGQGPEALESGHQGVEQHHQQQPQSNWTADDRKGVANVDADFALAMQLQQEEEERVRRTQQAQQQHQQEQEAARVQALRQQQQRYASEPPRPEKKKKSDCSIM